jgi:alkylhydroperoxidase/carboxymuconolactone decarboxylase family protein YurZ
LILSDPHRNITTMQKPEEEKLTTRAPRDHEVKAGVATSKFIDKLLTKLGLDGNAMASAEAVSAVASVALSQVIFHIMRNMISRGAEPEEVRETIDRYIAQVGMTASCHARNHAAEHFAESGIAIIKISKDQAFGQN